jgi:hypothetical protein
MQRECEQGQCYAEYRQEQDAIEAAEQQRAEEEYWAQQAEDEGHHDF